jgi:CHAT domain-containing protein/ketosteroid isomerase-like protein
MQRGSLCGAAVVFVALLCAGVVRAQQPDEAALRAVVADFYAAFERKDVAAVMSLWSADSPWHAKVKKEVEDQSAAADLAFTNFAVTTLALDGDRARVRAAADVRVTNRQTQRTQQDRPLYEIELVREGAAWKMWRNVSAWKALAERLLKAQGEAERAALVEREKELVSRRLALALVAEGNELLNRRDYKEALRAAQMGRDIAERVQDRGALFNAWLFIGNAHLRQADYDEALRAYEKCLGLGGGQQREAAMAQMGVANVNFQRGNYTTALEAYQQVGAIFRELKDESNAARSLNNIANVHYELGNYALALDTYRQSLAEHERLKSNKALVAETLNNIAVTYAEQANYARALDHLARARALADDAEKVRNTGVFYMNLGNEEQALHHFQLSLKRGEESNDRAQQARALRSIGIVHQRRGDEAQALEYYQKSLEMSRAVGNKPNVAATQRSIGQLLAQQKKYAEALAAFEESLKLSRESGDRSEAMQALVGMGRAYFAQSDDAHALRCADEATGIARAVEQPQHLWRSLELAGKIHLRQKRHDEAQRAFDEAAAVIERLRHQVVGGEQESQRFFQNKLDAYYGMVSLMAERGDSALALAYAERAKARVLLDTLQSGRVSVSKAMSAAEQGQERRLNNMLFSLNAQLQRERLRRTPDAQRVAALGADLQKARLDYEDFRTKLYAAHPELKVQRGEAQPVSAEEVGALLPDERTAFVEFAVADDRTHLFVITKGVAGRDAEIKIFPVAVEQKALAARVIEFRKLLADRDVRYSRAARGLYDLLLAPAAALLKGKTALVIVPDGPLWELPFQALVNAENRFLLEESALAYAPSLTVLRETVRLRRKSAEPPRAATLLALGNPAFGAQPTPPTAAGKPSLMDEKLEPLPEAEKQVVSLKGLYGEGRSRIFTGAEATEERFKAEAAGYGVLHLATHGILNDHNPMYSHLLLAQPAPDGKDAAGREDGLLEAWEILKMDLKADLAVLSACETARGKVSAGEGVIGLTWALFVAGVPTTVVSQWKVRSDSTANLMVEFHRQLSAPAAAGARVSKAEAMRRAALKLLRDKSSQYRHPFHWAGFVVVGDGL